MDEKWQQLKDWINESDNIVFFGGRGPERTYLWRTSCSARSIAGQLRTDRINAESI